MRTAAVVLLAAVLAFLPGSAMARDVFVDNSRGDDGNRGEKTESASDGSGPVRSIGRALDLASHGDRIVLAKTDEPYRESLSLSGSRHGGDAARPFLIAGNGATLDGSAPVEPGAWRHDRDNVFRFQPRRLGHQQLFLDGRPAPRVAVLRSGEALPKMEPGQWCLAGGQIYFCVAQDKLPADYALSYAREDVGITLTHVRHVAIADLTVQGFRLDGVNAANDAREVILLRVTCRGNGRSGAAVGGASLLHLTDSLLGDNGEGQLLALPWSETVVTGTELATKSGPACLHRGGRVRIDGKELEAAKSP